MNEGNHILKEVAKEFKKFARKYPLFSTSYLSFLNENLYSLRNQLARWEKEGLIIKLKRGLYILNEEDRKFIEKEIKILELPMLALLPYDDKIRLSDLIDKGLPKDSPLFSKIQMIKEKIA